MYETVQVRLAQEEMDTQRGAVSMARARWAKRSLEERQAHCRRMGIISALRAGRKLSEASEALALELGLIPKT